MTRLRIILTLFLVFGFTLTNCEEDDCGCPPNEGAYFDILGIESIRHFERVSETSISLVPDGGQVPFDNYYGFTMGFSVSYLSMNRGEKRHSSGIGQLYACSCLEYSGMEGAKHERLEEVTVITLNDFNESFKANDTINEILLVSGQPLNEYLAQNTELISHPYMTFSLDEQPSLSNPFKVKLVLELSTGEVYEQKSSAVMLEP